MVHRKPELLNQPLKISAPFPECYISLRISLCAQSTANPRSANMPTPTWTLDAAPVYATTLAVAIVAVLLLLMLLSLHGAVTVTVVPAPAYRPCSGIEDVVVVIAAAVSVLSILVAEAVGVADAGASVAASVEFAAAVSDWSASSGTPACAQSSSATVKVAIQVVSALRPRHYIARSSYHVLF